jgi:UDP-N-acetylglucosamine--N-acetylmuramyl-(pentapeptide) pyrophosphoryl-undecaprenol N-acetylglucosamine transferase
MTSSEPARPAAYLAARQRGLPIVVHEANARPGVANRLAAWMTTHVFTAAPGVRLAHATAIGIPLRPAITGLDRPALRGAARQRFGLRPDGPVSLVTGGSQGARAINASVSGAPDAGVVLARHVLTALAERRRLAS